MRRSQNFVTLSLSKRDVTSPRLRQAQADADEAAALKFGVTAGLDPGPSKRDVTSPRLRQAQADAIERPVLEFGVTLSLSKRGAAHRR